jgi:hypothetical protein
MKTSALALGVALVLSACGPKTPATTAGATLPRVPLTVDLAALEPGNAITLPVTPGTHVLLIEHMVPAARYNVQFAIESGTVEPLNLSQLQGVQGIRGLDEPALAPTRADSAATAAACNALRAAAAPLLQAAATTTEAEVRSAVATVEPMLRTTECSAESGHEWADALFRTVAARLGETRRTYRIAGLSGGDALVVRVVRLGTGTLWTKRFSTPARGEWQTTYGFAFPVTTWEFGSTPYVAEAAGDSTYVITEGANRHWLDFAPTIFFQWLPSSALRSDVVRGPTVGLGFDLQAPALFGGYGWTYNQNISLNVGVALHQQRVLLGRYEAGDTIRENLTPDQLHESLYRIAPFLAVSIRALSNPFARASEPEAAQP